MTEQNKHKTELSDAQIYRPSDIDSGRVQYYYKAEQDVLLTGLIGILKRNGNHWHMPRDRFEQVVKNIGASATPGGIASFIGIGSLERIADLGALDFGTSEVSLREEIIKHQIANNLRLLPTIRGCLRQRLTRHR